ncbi:hypothetical protein BDP67DRAFT_230060 [Colletotrichum lupini]|nr:hypothetical protein BDP67DRAFT_230060 [Colletotrichum lupini]
MPVGSSVSRHHSQIGTDGRDGCRGMSPWVRTYLGRYTAGYGRTAGGCRCRFACVPHVCSGRFLPPPPHGQQEQKQEQESRPRRPHSPVPCRVPKVHVHLYVPVQPGNTGHCTLGRFVYRPVSFSPFPRRDSDDSFEKLSLEPAHFSLVLSGLICHCPQDQGALSCCASDLRSKPRSDH